MLVKPDQLSPFSTCHEVLLAGSESYNYWMTTECVLFKIIIAINPPSPRPRLLSLHSLLSLLSQEFDLKNANPQGTFSIEADSCLYM